jgi:hypothetical protein
MKAVVRFTLPDDSIHELSPGDLIGRIETAALSLNDPRISEAHAMVSLRGSQLKLLALRGRLTLDTERLLEISLEPGLRIKLAPGLSLAVSEVHLPSSVIAVSLDGGTPQVLSRVVSLLAGPPPKLSPRPSPHALALAWTQHDKLWLRRPGLPDIGIAPGDSFVLDTSTSTRITLSVVRLPLIDSALPVTLGATTPLTIITWYESASIQAHGLPPLPLSGLVARLVSELAIFGAPTPWVVVARELWSDAATEDALRERWDATLGRLRKKLRAHGIARDLVRMSGAGHVELALTPHDRLENHA